jgi:hypothetical protein
LFLSFKDNKQLIQKYAELLNLLDKKDVFNYKTNASQPTSQSPQAQPHPPPLAHGHDEIALNFQRFVNL